MIKKYYPYPANDGKHKYYIITNNNKKVFFGAFGYSDYTIHKDDKRKQRYIDRHQKRESQFWDNPDKASYWALKLLWNKESIEKSYDDIRKDLKRLNLI